VNESSQELIMGTPQGAVKASEVKRKGSEEERWNMVEGTTMKGLPWKPDPNTAGYEGKTRVIVPIIRAPDEQGQPGTKPFYVQRNSDSNIRVSLYGPNGRALRMQSFGQRRCSP